MAEPVIDIILGLGLVGVGAYMWWQTRPLKVLVEQSKADKVHVEPYDHGGLV